MWADRITTCFPTLRNPCSAAESPSINRIACFNLRAILSIDYFHGRSVNFCSVIQHKWNACIFLLEFDFRTSWALFPSEFTFPLSFHALWTDRGSSDKSCSSSVKKIKYVVFTVRECYRNNAITSVASRTSQRDLTTIQKSQFWSFRYYLVIFVSRMIQPGKRWGRALGNQMSSPQNP